MPRILNISTWDFLCKGAANSETFYLKYLNALL